MPKRITSNKFSGPSPQHCVCARSKKRFAMKKTKSRIEFLKNAFQRCNFLKRSFLETFCDALATPGCVALNHYHNLKWPAVIYPWASAAGGSGPLDFYTWYWDKVEGVLMVQFFRSYFFFVAPLSPPEIFLPTPLYLSQTSSRLNVDMWFNVLNSCCKPKWRFPEDWPTWLLRIVRPVPWK